MLGQSTIGIFKAKADYMRNCKVAVEGNVSGIEPFVRDPGKRASRESLRPEARMNGNFC
jgi:hypothetical protein